MTSLIWSVGDTQPSITETVTSGGVPVNLSLATATFNMRPVGSTALKVSASATIVAPKANGNLQYDWQAADVDTVGTYLIWWDVDVSGSTALQSVGEAIIEFRDHSPIIQDLAPGYVELEEMKKTLALSGQSYGDLDMQGAIIAASRAIDNSCSRFFYNDPPATASTSYYNASTTDLVIVDDLISCTELAVDYSGAGTYNIIFDPSWYMLGPYNNPTIGWPYEWIQRRPLQSQWFPSYLPKSIRVTGRHGWPAVPGPIKDATIMLAHRLIRRKREAPFGILTVGMESMRAIRIEQSDPDVAMMINPYKRQKPFA